MGVTMENNTVSMLEQFIPQLDLVEKGRLLRTLKSAIENEYAHEGGDEKEDDGETHVCPHCGCMKSTRKGTSTGHQRYLCGGCARTFNDKTGKILSTTKLPLSTWLEYAECMIDRLTLRACAEKCGVGLKTSFFMRHRVCECMENYLSSFEVGVGCGAQIDEVFIRESFSGNHHHNEDFACPVA